MIKNQSLNADCIATRNAPSPSPYPSPSNQGEKHTLHGNRENEKTNNENYYRNLLKNGTVELRCLDKNSDKAKASKNGLIAYAGFYSTYDSLRQALITSETRSYDSYVLLNPTRIPATNTYLRPFMRTTRDVDVLAIKNIFFDFDTENKDENGASDVGVMMAVEQAEKTAIFLSEHGWGRPTLGMSGNGAHLIYRVDMTVEQVKNIHGLYAGLEKRFSNDAVKFDISVKNPARIARAYGTTNQKGGRRSTCLFSSDVSLSAAVLDTISLLTPPKQKRFWVNTNKDAPTQAGRYVKNLDVVGVFASAGLYLSTAFEGGKHFVTCPWSNEHSSTGATDTVIWEGEWAQFHCSHDHCAGRKISDVIEVMGVTS
jgi:hypothetical protein